MLEVDLLLPIVKFLMDTSGELATAWRRKGNISEEKYAQRILSGQEDVLSQPRTELIKRAKGLHNQILEYVPEVHRDKLITMFEESRAKSYGASTSIQLEEIDISLDYLENRIDKFKQQNHYRENGRRVAVVFSAVLLILLIGSVILAATNNLQGTLTDKDFQKNTILGIPASIILWSMFGSFVAIPMQSNKYMDAEIQDMLRWALTRPVTGIAMGIILYLAVKIGIVLVNPNENANLINLDIMSLAAFIGGLSDPLADRILGSVINRFGGNADDGILKSVGQAAIFQETQVEFAKLLQEVKDLKESLNENSVDESSSSSELPATPMNEQDTEVRSTTDTPTQPLPIGNTEDNVRVIEGNLSVSSSDEDDMDGDE